MKEYWEFFHSPFLYFEEIESRCWFDIDIECLFIIIIVFIKLSTCGPSTSFQFSFSFYTILFLLNSRIKSMVSHVPFSWYFVPQIFILPMTVFLFLKRNIVWLMSICFAIHYPLVKNCKASAKIFHFWCSSYFIFILHVFQHVCLFSFTQIK